MLTEDDKRVMNERNRADVQPTHDGTSAVQLDMNPKVIMFCPQCDAAQTVEMEMLWKKGFDGRRFVHWSCTEMRCKQKRKSIGNWLRFQKEPGSKISTWLRKIGYADVYTRPQCITVKDYVSHEVVSCKVQREGRQSGKRKAKCVEEK